MPEENIVLPLGVERPASVRYGSTAAKNTIGAESAATWDQSPASPPEPSSPHSGHSPYGRDTERERARGIRRTEARSSDRDSNIVRPPPPATTRPTTGESGQEQMAYGNRSLGPTARYDEKETSAPKIFAARDQAHYRDLEKSLAGHQQSFESHHTLPPTTEHPTTVYTAYSEDVEEDEDEGEEEAVEAEEDGPKKHAMRILIHLSAFSPLVSLITSLYAVLAILLALVVSPFYLYTTKNAITVNLHRFLVPPLRLQLRLVYADLDFDPDDDDDIDDDDDDEVDVDVENGAPNRRITRSSSTSQSSTMLILVNILSPLYSIGIAIAAWVAAGFWFTAAILGDPNVVKEKNNNPHPRSSDISNGPSQDASARNERRRGSRRERRRQQQRVDESQEGGGGDDTDDDGKRAVMTVRGWWVGWLGKGLRTR